MNHKILLISFLQIFCYLSYGQYQQLENLEETVIGPENVSLHFEEQVEYYLEKYLAFEQELEEKEIIKFNALAELKKLEKKKWKDKNRIIDMSKSIESIQKDRSLLNEYITMWSEYLGSEMNRKFEEEYLKEQCYIFETSDVDITEDAIVIQEIDKSQTIFWNEVILLQKRENIEEQIGKPKTVKKWVRKKTDRNCLSADPDDCLVWCLVDVPVEKEISSEEKVLIRKGYKKWVRKKKKENCFSQNPSDCYVACLVEYPPVYGTTKMEECPVNFEFNKVTNSCDKEVEMENLSDDNTAIKIIDINTNKEILILDFKAVKCN